MSELSSAVLNSYFYYHCNFFTAKLYPGSGTLLSFRIRHFQVHVTKVHEIHFQLISTQLTPVCIQTFNICIYQFACHCSKQFFSIPLTEGCCLLRIADCIVFSTDTQT